MKNRLALFSAISLVIFPSTVVVVDTVAGLFAFIAALLGFFSLLKLKNPPNVVTMEEIIFFTSVTLLFVTAVITSVYTDTDLATASRFPNFILIIPLYAFLRFNTADEKYVWLGLVAGTFATLACALYQVIWLQLPRAGGSVSAVLFGNSALIMGTMALAGAGWFREQGKWMIIVPVLAFVAGLIGSALSQSRGGWVALPFLGLVLIWYARRYVSIKEIATMLALTLVIVGVIYILPQTGVQIRVNIALLDIEAYLNGHYSVDPSKISSTSVRFEMWKAAWLIFLDNPILGVGWGNYVVETKALIEQGIINQEASGYPHAHNQFLSALAKGGLLGFLAVAILLFYPLSIFLKYTHIKYQPEINRFALAGFIFILGFALFCLTDALLEKSRTIILFCFYVAVFMAMIRSRLDHDRP